MIVSILNTNWFNPLSPDKKICILYGTSKENFSKYQDISSLVIVSFILIT